MWARIDDTKTVREIIGFDPAGMFHPDIRWVECNESISVGMLYDELANDFSEVVVEVNPRVARDRSISSMKYDFGDGRIIQTRPSDWQNIKYGIDILGRIASETLDWVMIDNKKYPVTAQDLSTALLFAEDEYLSIWENFSP